MSQKYGLDADLQAKAIAKYSKDDEAKAKAWIEEVTGEKMVSFMEGLKTGVILCKLANAIMPGSVGKFAPNPKHYLDFKGNISLYCAACVKMGLPSQDMITPIDLSDTRSDPSQVLSHIFAVARQSQAIGFRGPSLGVTYYKSREEQIALEQKRNREREEERRKKEEYDRMLLEKRDVAIAKKQARQTVKIEQNSDRRKRRIEERESRGRKSLREAPGVSDVAQRSPSPVLYGMDAEHAERIEAALLDWIEEITGYAMNGFVENLRTGVVLCELINKIRPGMIRQINIKIGRKSSALGERENIKKFLDACVGLGIPPGDLFLPQDLYDQKNLLQVQHGLWTLATHCATSLHHTNLPKVVDPYGSGFSSRYPKTPRPDKQGGVCYPKVASPAPTGYSAVFLVLFALFISFFAGFGNITGNTSIQYFVNLCNSTLNDTQTCHENPHFFELTNGAEFLAFFVSGLLLSFTGPKAVVSTGLALKMIGCILLGFAYLMPILWETGLSLVAAGGPFVLIGLFTLSDFHPHKFSLSNFSLVSAFITGSLVLSLLSTHLEANNLQ